jgi:hypothetical protein
LLLVERARRWAPRPALIISRRLSLSPFPRPTLFLSCSRPADAPCRAPPAALPRRSSNRPPEVKATPFLHPPLM